MAQHRRANSSGQHSAVHLHLKEKNLSFEDNNVNILAREYRWFERTIYIKLEQQSLNRGGCLRHYLSPTYDAVLLVLSPDSLKTFYTWAHLALATHMRAVFFTNKPQVVLTTLKLRAHTRP